MEKILVVLGPTATGKTELALRLAKKFNGELIACDSRQVYSGLDIGTGKLPGYEAEIIKGKGFWEINGIKVWMYDVVSLREQYTVADYVKDAERIVEDILKRKKIPIVVGGTGFYLKALLEGLPNLEISVDRKLRGELAKLSLMELQDKLKKLSLPRWENLNESDQKNPRRLLRSIELATMNPYIITQNQRTKKGNGKYNVLKIGLTAPRMIIYQKIDHRVLDWIKYGIVEEVKNFLLKGIPKRRINELGLEYAVVLEYLDGVVSFDEMVGKIQNKVRQYSKRQVTWFKKEKNIFWFDITEKEFLQKLENLIAKWYDSRTVYGSKS